MKTENYIWITLCLFVCFLVFKLNRCFENFVGYYLDNRPSGKLWCDTVLYKNKIVNQHMIIGKLSPTAK